MSIAGYLCMPEKRQDTRLRTVVAVRTCPRMSGGKVEVHEFYTRAEVRLDSCDPIVVTSIYLPHSRSKRDDSAPREQLIEQCAEPGARIIIGDLNWTGNYATQRAPTPEIDETD